MNWRTWTLLVGMSFLLVQCGNMTDEDSVSNRSSAGQVGTLLKGQAYAQFGTQCPLGFYGDPQPVQVELWNCPVNRKNIELLEPLQPIVMQADCKKKTLDVRIAGPGAQSITWEFMPDGNFNFSMNAGYLKVTDDGAGHQNCSIPLSLDMWGRVECSDRDHAVIHSETVWWVGRTIVTATPTPSGAPSGIPTPQPTPHFPPVIHPTPRPSASPRPRILTFLNGEVLHAAPVGSVCTMPESCYFHNISHQKQCP